MHQLTVAPCAEGSQSEDAERLQSLQIDPAICREAVHRGVVDSFSCTAHDAPNAAGYYAWERTLRNLRDALVLHGWHIENQGGYCLTVAPDGRIRIVVATGNHGTGRPEGQPRTGNPKGMETRKAVDRNQLRLFTPEDSPKGQGLEHDVGTWVLLFYVDEAVNEIRLELSLPIEMDQSGYVHRWKERLILEPIPLTPCAVEERDDERGEEISIEIRRRTS